MWLSQMLSTVPTLAPSQLPCGVTCVSIRSRMPISMMMPSSSGRLLTCSLVMVWGGGVMPQAYHSTARTWHPKYANHKLKAPRPSEEQADLLFRAARSGLLMGLVSLLRQIDILPIPETPLVYWLRPRFIQLLQSPNRLRDVAEVRVGLQTSDNERFLRCFWEIQGYESQRKNSTNRWHRLLKGGRYQKWTGLEWLVVDWAYNGQRLRLFGKAVIRNEDYYFRSGLSYSLMAQGSIGTRAICDAI